MGNQPFSEQFKCQSFPLEEHHFFFDNIPRFKFLKEKKKVPLLYNNYTSKS